MKEHMDRLGSGWESWPGFDRRPAQSPLRPVPFGLKTARPAEKGAVSGINRLPGYFFGGPDPDRPGHRIKSTQTNSRGLNAYPFRIICSCPSGESGNAPVSHPLRCFRAFPSFRYFGLRPVMTIKRVVPNGESSDNIDLAFHFVLFAGSLFLANYLGALA
jgi:hypothetical protein